MKPGLRGLADDYKRLVFERTALKPCELECPREKSEMTPCVARDGDLAMTADGHCAGCDLYIESLVRTELSHHSRAEQLRMIDKYADKLTYTIDPRK